MQQKIALAKNLLLVFAENKKKKTARVKGIKINKKEHAEQNSKQLPAGDAEIVQGSESIFCFSLR
jgi:hypothetical protein